MNHWLIRSIFIIFVGLVPMALLAVPMPPFWKVIACEADAMAQFPVEDRTEANQKLYAAYCATLKRHQMSYIKAIRDPMTGWTEKNLSGYLKTVFYPFAGSDIVTAVGLFPQATLFVKMSLEHPGHLPSMAGLSFPRAYRDLLRFQAFMRQLMEWGFENTNKLSGQDFNGNLIPGILPASIYQLTARNMICSEIRYVEIDAAGKLVFVDTPEEPKGKRAIGLEVKFGPRDNPKKYTFIHFRADLADFALKHNGKLIEYIKSLGKTTTLLKAASYVLHWGTFSIMRGRVLEQSEYIVQDSSGIPLNYFDRNPGKNWCWSLDPYGVYVPPPSPVCTTRTDPFLVKLFKGKSEKLPFYFGYRLRRDTSDLVILIRRRCD